MSCSIGVGTPGRKGEPILRAAGNTLYSCKDLEGWDPYNCKDPEGQNPYNCQGLEGRDPYNSATELVSICKRVLVLPLRMVRILAKCHA